MRVCIIPARGGSKGIKDKNTKYLKDKPLVCWTILSALNSKCFDEIVVSTDSQKIINVVKEYDIVVHNRSQATSADDVHSVNVVLECIKDFGYKDSDIISMLLPTSPLRNAQDISAAMNGFCDCDSLISVIQYDKPISCIRVMDGSYLKPIVPTSCFENQRQDVEPMYEVNGSIYISTVKNIRNVKSFHEGLIKPFVMNKLNSIDINNIDDFRLAEALLG